MEWQIIVALALAVPIILLPVAFVWFLNMGGILAALRETRARRVAHKKEAREAVRVTAQK